METLSITVNRDTIFNRCNVYLTLHRSITGMSAEPEIIMHSHGRQWFDVALAEAVEVVVAQLDRISKNVEQKLLVTDTDIEFFVVPQSAEQVRRLGPAIERYLTDAIVESWGAGKVEGVPYGKANIALSELKHITLMRERTYRLPNF